MKIFKITPLENCNSLEEVVDLINTTTEFDKEDVAAIYAFESAVESGYEIHEEEIAAHLDVLIGAGAEFDYQKSLKIALSLELENE